jgi:hypothetical protein
MTHREPDRCSFLDAIRRRECPHYRPGKSPKECHAYETQCTQVRTTRGITHIYHCRHDPLEPIQQSLW